MNGSPEFQTCEGAPIASPIISTENKSSHEKRNEYCRQWRKDNKDRISEYNRIYATQHRSEIKERIAHLSCNVRAGVGGIKQIRLF